MCVKSYEEDVNTELSNFVTKQTAEETLWIESEEN